jgi:hypothetical protein
LGRRTNYGFEKRQKELKRQKKKEKKLEERRAKKAAAGGEEGESVDEETAGEKTEETDGQPEEDRG